MSTGFLILKPKIGDNKKASEDAKVNIEQENNSSSNPATGSKSCATSSTTTKPKNNTERGEAKRGDAFNIYGNTIEGSNSERSSNFGAVLQRKKERGKKKTKGRSSNFIRITDNKIEGCRAKRVVIFQCCNTHVHEGHQKEIQVDSSSGETDSASSEEEE